MEMRVYVSFYSFGVVGDFRIADRDELTIKGPHPDPEPPDERSPLSIQVVAGC